MHIKRSPLLLATSLGIALHLLIFVLASLLIGREIMMHSDSKVDAAELHAIILASAIIVLGSVSVDFGVATMYAYLASRSSSTASKDGIWGSLRVSELARIAVAGVLFFGSFFLVLVLSDADYQTYRPLVVPFMAAGLDLAGTVIIIPLAVLVGVIYRSVLRRRQRVT